MHFTCKISGAPPPAKADCVSASGKTRPFAPTVRADFHSRPKFGVIYVDLVFAVKVSIDIPSTFLNHSKHIHVCRLSLLHFMNLLCLGLYECTEVIWMYSPAEICSVPDGTSHWVQFGTAMRSPIKNTKTECSTMFVWLQVSKCIDSIECT